MTQPDALASRSASGGCAGVVAGAGSTGPGTMEMPLFDDIEVSHNQRRGMAERASIP